MRKHFVTFLSPGTFFHETTTKDIDAWDVEKATAMAADISERYRATPFAFYFTTRERGVEDFDSRQAAKSPTYYLGGKIRTYEEVCAENNSDEEILRNNMRCNNWKRVVTNTNSYRITQLLEDGDIVLDYTPIKGAKK